MPISFPSSIINKSRNRTSPQAAKVQFPTAEKLAYGMVFKFNKASYDLQPGSKAKFSNLTSDSHIFLPLPTSGIVETLGVNYQPVEIGVAGQLMAAGGESMEAVRSALGGASSADQQLIGAAVNNVNTFAGSAAVALRSALNSAVPGAGAFVDITSGSVVNPYALTLFQNVSARAHQLEFKLIPRNQSDSEVIRKIVRQFQFHSLPSRKDKFFLTMPDEVELSFFGTDKLFKFAPCYLTTVSVNYSPLGIPSFFGADNSPVAVTLSLSFQEIEALSRESYEQDGVSDAFGVDAQNGAFAPPGGPPAG